MMDNGNNPLLLEENEIDQVHPIRWNMIPYLVA
jgi:hypothetical protein